mmetsp:Transcript_35803/g.83575  ORF Transcript_35803/g.83575 Transcript_35803/m.83575 type:complete len:225 (-) Transcript_35803:306-980(-)
MSERKVVGRAPGGNRNRSGGRSNTPYTRPARKQQEEMEASDSFKVSGTSVPQKVAGAICNTVRESPGAIPGVMATGPAAINQAIKAIAIARKYLLEESPPIYLTVKPVFEKDLRSGSNVTLELTKSKRIDRDPTEDDLTAKEKTDCFKLAGAIAGRIRDGEEVAVTTKGQIPVLVAVKAIALAQDYTRDEGLNIKFAVKFVDLEDPEINNIPSTYLHFAILGQH